MSATTNPSSQSAATASRELPLTIRNFRRPSTEDRTRFWFCSTAKWQSLIDAYLDDTVNDHNRKMIGYVLRLYDFLRNICEPDVAVQADEPCNFCVRSDIPCMVFEDGRAQSCVCCYAFDIEYCSAVTAMDGMSMTWYQVTEVRERALLGMKGVIRGILSDLQSVGIGQVQGE